MLIVHASVLFFCVWQQNKIDFGERGKISIMSLNACLWKSHGEFLL